jgi:hypothetical protein
MINICKKARLLSPSFPPSQNPRFAQDVSLITASFPMPSFLKPYNSGQSRAEPEERMANALGR